MINEPTSHDFEIKRLERELKTRESHIESLKELLANNQSMLQDVIAEKKELKRRVQGYDLSLVDAKLKQYQKLQEDHQKTVHRLQVTKKHLDNTNNKLKELEREMVELKQIIEDLNNRGLFDYIRSKYPESYQKYRER
jgi:chromosome segregation ATPase